MREQGFAVWLTGLPGSGKSTIAGLLKDQLKSGGLSAVVLESDVLRREMIRKPGYEQRDRELFYSTVVLTGKYLVDSGANIIVDATCNLRMFRDEARKQIEKFVEVYVNCPLEECVKRDPKGIYGRGASEKTGAVPGLEAVYEPPLGPEIEVDSAAEPPEQAARRIADFVRTTVLKEERIR